MKPGKIAAKAISVALLAATFATSLPQANILSAVQDGMLINYTYYNNDAGIPETTANDTARKEEEKEEKEKDAESAENEKTEAASDNRAEENSAAFSDENNTGGTRGGGVSYTEPASDDYTTSIEETDTASENPLTDGNHTSEYVTLDKPAIGFTKVGDIVSVTAKTTGMFGSGIRWSTSDSSVLNIKSTANSENSSTADIEWIGGTGTASFFAALTDNPDEYAEGTAMLFDNSASLDGDGDDTETETGETNEDSELKTEFESPEVEEFLRQMYADGLTQENSDYDLSKLMEGGSDKPVDETAADKTDETEDKDDEYETAENSAAGNQSETVGNDTDTVGESSVQTGGESENEGNSSYLNGADTSEGEQTAAKTETTYEEETKTRTVTSKQNVSRETVTTTTVTTEIIDQQTEYETVVNTVEKQVPVATPVEIETEVPVEGAVDENGEVIGGTQYVTETQTVYETTYETVTEEVEEQVPVLTQYTVRETTTTENVTTETVTDEDGTVVSQSVVNSDTSSSSRDYVTTEKPSVGTTTDVAASTTSDTIENTTEETYTVQVEKETEAEVQSESNDDAETVGSPSADTETQGALSSVEPQRAAEAQAAAQAEVSYNTQSISGAADSEEIQQVDLSDPSDPQTAEPINEVNNVNTISIRVGEQINLEAELERISGSAVTVASMPTVMDTRLAEIISGGGLQGGYNITGVAEGRTKLYFVQGAGFKVLNIDVFGKEQDATAVPMVVSNRNFSLALKNDGTLWGWGNIGDNELGNLMVTDDAQNTPYKMEIKEDGRLRPLEGIKNVAVGDGHVLAVTKEGLVYSWGLNRNGQLGTGFKYTGTNPVYVQTSDGENLRDITYVAAGNFSSYAIDKNGDVYSWGYNYNGQLGNGSSGGEKLPDGSYDSDVLYATKIGESVEGFNNIIKITASGSHAMALKNDGTVFVWGLNGEKRLLDSSQDSDVIALPTKLALSLDGVVVDIAAGGGTSSAGASGDEAQQLTNFHSLVLTGSHSVYSWGNSAEGVLGIETGEDIAEPRKIEISPIAAINSGIQNSVAVGTDGRLYAWGRNDEGEIGNPDHFDARVLTPQVVLAGESNEDNHEAEMSDVVLAVPGATHMIALRMDGTVYAWGSNSFGQLGNGKNGADQKEPLAVRVGDEESSSLVMEHVLVVSSTGEIAGEYNGSESIPEKITITDAQKVNIEIGAIKKYYRTGFNLVKRDEKSDIDTSTLSFKSNNTKIATVNSDDFNVWEIVTPTPLEPSGERGVVEIEATSEGYVGVLRVDVKSPNDFAEPMIASGDDFTIALKSDGSVWAWGANDFGQLGNGTFDSSQGPVPVLDANGKNNLSGIFKIAAGGHHALAMTSDGAVLAWGLNDHGQLGIFTTENKNIPQKVLGGDYSSTSGYITLASDIAAGGRHSLAVIATGAVYAWGANDHGQLGNTRNSNDITPNAMERTPVRVVYGTEAPQDGTNVFIETAIAVAAGENHSVVLLDENKEIEEDSNAVLAWGANNYGQLGIEVKSKDDETLDEPSDDAQDQIAPSEIPWGAQDGNVNNIKAIAAGKYHTVIGSNEYGELGRGSDKKFICEVRARDSLGISDNVIKENGDSIADAVAIAAGGRNTSVIDNAGNVYNFGSNKYGQIGSGTETEKESKAKEITEFSEKTYYSAYGAGSGFVVRKDGYVWAYGFNGDGQLGDLSRTNAKTPVQVGAKAEEMVELSVSVPDEQGTVSVIDKPNIVTVLPKQQIRVNGANVRTLRGFTLFMKDEDVRSVSNFTYESSDTSVAEVSGNTITAVAPGSAVIKATGNNGLTGMFVVNVKASASDEQFYTEPMVVAGDKFSVALKSDGTVWTWGHNASGQLGNGTIGEEMSQYSPVQVSGAEGTGESALEKIVAIAAGSAHAVALSYDGRVYAWGSNVYGQLGNGRNGVDNVYKEDEDIHDDYEYDEVSGVYTIYTAEGLDIVREHLSDHFVLGADIDLGGSDFEPIGSTNSPFLGEFDGNGYQIKGLDIRGRTVAGESMVGNASVAAGLFGVNGGTIKRVILKNANVINTTTQVDSEGMSTSVVSVAGGIAGYNNGTIMESAVLSGTISSYNMSGAIAGVNAGKIIDSYNRAEVAVQKKDDALPSRYVGGITASNIEVDRSYIRNTYSSGSITASEGTHAGGPGCRGRPPAGTAAPGTGTARASSPRTGTSRPSAPPAPQRPRPPAWNRTPGPRSRSWPPPARPGSAPRRRSPPAAPTSSGPAGSTGYMR